MYETHKKMKIGFTGTQRGMTNNQKELFTKLIIEKNPSEFHHGDCIGADYDAHILIQEINKDISIIIHPPVLANKRAFCSMYGCKTEYKVKEYIERNKDIVDDTDLLIACPKSDEEQRSGTWSTIRYARKQNKKVIILGVKNE